MNNSSFTDLNLPLNVSEVRGFADANTSFGFEMSVVKILSARGFSVRHGGTYTDAVSGKIRQFDIRAEYQFGPFPVSQLHVARLAIECKAFKKAAPLLIHRVKRTIDESFDELFVTAKKTPEKLMFELNQTWIAQRTSHETLYSSRDFVGKDMDLLRRGQAGAIKGGDGEVFEKMSQCLSSAVSLISEIAATKPNDYFQIHSVIPLLVVPDGTLWAIDYKEDGSVAGDPILQEHVDYFVDRKIKKRFIGAIKFPTVSHMQIVTIGGLQKLLRELYDFNGSNRFATAFGRPEQIARLISFYGEQT